MFNDRLSTGASALLLVLGSALVGGAYFAYLTVVPFPPDIVRLVPIAWLVASLVGGGRATRALSAGDGRRAAGLALVLDIPNVVFAAMFSLAAVMGD